MLSSKQLNFGGSSIIGVNLKDNFSENYLQVLETLQSAIEPESKIYLLSQGQVYTGTDFAETLNGGIGDDTVYGLAGNDTIYGNDGNDVIDGGLGGDAMYGGQGDDIYYMNNSYDRPMGEVAGAGVDTLVSTLSLFMNEFSEFVENAVAEDNGKDLFIWGNEASNYLYGNDASNLLVGLGANDHLYGNGSEDTLEGGAGRDHIDGGEGIDLMKGGAHDDYFYVDDPEDKIIEYAGEGDFDTVITSVPYVLPAYVEEAFATSDTRKGNITGNSLDNEITGNGLANRLSGGSGNDVLIGLGGKDTLTGGLGKDCFIFDLLDAAGPATIQDFVHGEKIVFQDEGSLPTGALPASMFILGDQAQDANDRVIYDRPTGNLYFDPDGTGSTAQMWVAILTNKPEINHLDFAHHLS